MTHLLFNLYISSSCETAIRKGSNKEDIHDMVLQVHEFCSLNAVDLKVAWVGRDQNMEADFMSKFDDTDDWSVKMVLFEKIECLANYKFSLDVFATDVNTKCEKFYSRYMVPGSLGVDSLLFCWNNEVVWAVPPVVLAVRCVKHMKFSKCKGCLVLPDWSSLPVWSFLEQDSFKKYVKQSWIFPGGMFLENLAQLSPDLKGNQSGGLYEITLTRALYLCQVWPG